ncbi:MAG: 16S rRNA (guanine(527)-N(7))-methyltransferase RsmG [Planctomycetota bacterium]|nr:16S rRNA (guanine(527)-N(7))-methyltransferase RsmG [Planctomycetota bacterium]
MSSFIQKPSESFLASLTIYGIELESGDLVKLGEYLRLLYAANESMNLTSVPLDQAWDRHIADSLSLMPFVASADAKRIVDVGSGGGLPALPLAICLPDCQFDLVESTGKKAKFLEETATALGLLNVKVHNARAEAVGASRGGDLRGCADIVTSRAVGRLKLLLEICIPLVKVGGLMLTIKGEQVDVEVTESEGVLRALGSTIVNTQRGPTGTVVAVRKVEETSRAYPRAPGTHSPAKTKELGGVNTPAWGRNDGRSGPPTGGRASQRSGPPTSGRPGQRRGRSF